ncbi:MAG: T9SS type B sorting domain-containing protein [Bacteroidia bacterium]
MKTKLFILTLLVVSTIGLSQAQTTCGTCALNSGFETGNTTNWEAKSGTIGNLNGGLVFSNNTPNNDPAQHTVVTSGNDEVGGFPRVCNLIAGNTKSLRLGNNLGGTGSESISYGFTVNAANPFFVYYYAVVLGNTGNTPAQSANFSVSMLDGTNAPIACTALLVDGSNINTLANSTAVGAGAYVSWTRVVVPLKAYVGQCVKITFTTKDNALGGHSGYAYIDAACETEPIITAPAKNCSMKTQITLNAPTPQVSEDATYTYLWTGPRIQGAANGAAVNVLGSGHWDCAVTITQTAGGACSYTLGVDVLPENFIPKADFTYVVPCEGQTTNFINTSTPAGIWTNIAWDIANDNVVDVNTLDVNNVAVPNHPLPPLYTAPPLPRTPLPQVIQYIPVKLTMSNATCSIDTVIQFRINPKPYAFAGSDKFVCAGLTEVLTPSEVYNNDLDSLFTWYKNSNFNTKVGENTNTDNIPPSIPPIGLHTGINNLVKISYSALVNVAVTYNLILTNSYGCKDTDAVDLTINPNCCIICENNPGFESTNPAGGSFYKWSGAFGNIGGMGLGNDISAINSGNGTNQSHNIMTSGNDEVGGFPRVCNLLPDNHTSLRLGNIVGGSRAENITYSFIVQPNKPYFTYYYAVVLQNGGHAEPDQPIFSVSMRDAVNQDIACARFVVNGTTAGAIGGFTNAGGGIYCAWRAVTIPLTANINTCVQITFATNDCSFGGHAGYAYIDAACIAPEVVSEPTICDNGKSTITLRAPLGAGSYAWTGPGIPATSLPADRDTVVITKPGTYTCTMTTIIAGGGAPCAFTVTRTVLAAPNPTASFTNNTACSKEPVKFNNTSAPSGIWTRYSWDYNNDGTVDNNTINTEQSFVNQTGAPIQIPVKLKLENLYCTADTVINITINPEPVADAGIDQGICEGAIAPLVSITPSVTNQWYNDLNNYALVASTNAAYNVSPLITSDYTLVVTNQYGCKDTDDVRVNVDRLPKPEFVAADVCYPDSTKFVSLSTNTNVGDVLTWLYEPGKTANGNVTNYAYAACGAKNVTLIITTPNNCVNTITKSINVLCKPNADFTVANMCLYDSATFVSTSVGNTTITNYQWDFNYVSPTLNQPSFIENKSTLQNPKFGYFVDGTKNVVLVVTNNVGCKDSVIKQLVVYPTPNAEYSVPNTCLNTVSTFTSTSTINAPDNITQYQWDYTNDGVVDASTPVNTKTYTYPTMYKGNSSLIVTSNNGCKDTAIVPVEIYPLPVASFFAQDKCADSVVTFTNNSTVSYGTIKTSSWLYTPANAVLSSGTPTTTFIFNAENYYPVLLTTTTNFGCIDTQLQTVIIYPNPIPSFSSPQAGCAPFCITETNTSTITNSPVPSTIVKYNWSFGNGDVSTTFEPSYCYANAVDYKTKTFDITLVTESNFGCVNTLLKPNYMEIYPKPKAAFYATPTTYVMGKELVQVYDSSIIATVINWDYDVNYNPITLEKLNYKTLNYTDSGTYIITQAVESEHGCLDTAYTTIVVKPTYNLFVPNAFTPNTDGNNETFNPKYFGLTKLTLTIYNRWGDIIATIDETTKKGWDGTDYRTQEKCKTDVYIWKAKYTTVLGNEDEANGKVTLLR